MLIVCKPTNQNQIVQKKVVSTCYWMFAEGSMSEPAAVEGCEGTSLFFFSLLNSQLLYIQARLAKVQAQGGNRHIGTTAISMMSLRESLPLITHGRRTAKEMGENRLKDR